MENETGIIKENPKRTVKDTLFKGFFAYNKKAFVDLQVITQFFKEQKNLVAHVG